MYRVLGNLLGLEGFVYRDIQELQHEIQHKHTTQGEVSDHTKPLENIDIAPSQTHEPMQLHRVGLMPIYRVDPIVRRAKALQKVHTQSPCSVCLHPKTAQKLHVDKKKNLKLRMGRKSYSFPLQQDDRIAEGYINIPAGVEQTQGLGGLSDVVEVLS